MSALLDNLTRLNPDVVYLIVAVLVFAEDALLVGHTSSRDGQPHRRRQ